MSMYNHSQLNLFFCKNSNTFSFLTNHMSILLEFWLDRDPYLNGINLKIVIHHDETVAIKTKKGSTIELKEGNSFSFNLGNIFNSPDFIF